MASDRRTAGLDSTRDLLATGTLTGLEDAHLLDRFATGRGEVAQLAFAVLVERHGPMVLRVCRAVLRDHDAEDAFQATFLILARKARSIRRRASLASWLHGVAHNVASTARATAARRSFHEQRAGSIRPETTRSGGHEEASVIQEELRRLPERFRAVVVLCNLEGLTQLEAADRLGWPLGTVQSRLARGRDLLRSRLTRRGLAPALGVAGALHGGRTARAAMSVELVSSVVRAAVELASPAGTGAVSTQVSRMISQHWRAVMVQKLKLAAIGVFAVGSLAGMVAIAQDAARKAENPPPAQAGTDTGRVGEFRPGIIAIPGPPPGRRMQIILAVVGKLSNSISLECGTRGRLRAVVSTGVGGQTKRVLEGPSLRLDGSRRATAGADSMGEVSVETVEGENRIILPGPRPGEPMQLEFYPGGRDVQRLMVSSELGDRLRVKYLGEGGMPTSGDVLCTAIRFDGLFAAE